MLLPKIDRFAPIGGFPDNGHVCFPTNERNQTFADNAVIISNEYRDTRFFCGSNFRHFLRSRVLFLCTLARLRRCFLFGSHYIDSPLPGNTTVIFVPLPRELVISNSPPIWSTRSRIPLRPTPSCRSLALNPSPSSRSSKRSFFALYVSRVSKWRAWAYLSALVSASCPMWRRFSCQGWGSSGS